MSHADWVPTTSPSIPPDPPTLAWVEAATGQRVGDVEALVGGLSSAVHRLHLDGDGDRLVLRRYTLGDWLEREPHIPFDEQRNLQVLADMSLGVDTPRLVASDPDGSHCDYPAILMTEVGGRPYIDPADPHDWAEKLAICLARIHEQPAVDGLPDARRWDDPSTPVPSWTGDEALWLEAKRRGAVDLPAHPVCFQHRDYHPNNIHWENGEICAVVDWLGACNGPVAVDLSHCRWNLAVLASPEIAEHFTEQYRLLTGYSEDVTTFDLATVLSGPVGPFPTHAWNSLGRADLTSESVAPKIDDWLRWVMG